MNRGWILPVMLVVLIGMGVFVTAQNFFYEVPGGNNYQITIEVEEGWNLIQGFHPDFMLAGGQIADSNVKAVFMYSPDKNEYIEIYPENRLPDAGLDPNDEYYDDGASFYAYWVYIEDIRSCTDSACEVPGGPLNKLVYTIRFGEWEGITMKKGWNFVGVNPDLIDVDFGNLKGDCEIEKYYWWDYVRQVWFKLYLTDNLEPGMLGTGFVLKVSDDCRLGSNVDDGGTITPPPVLPNGGIDSQLRTDIRNYYYDEFAYEDCELNNYQNYNSKQACEDAWACLADEFKLLVADADLEEVAEDMKENGGEGGYINYVENNPSVKTQLESKYNTCLSGRHNDY